LSSDPDMRVCITVTFAVVPMYEDPEGETPSKTCCRDCSLYSPTAVIVVTRVFGARKRTVLRHPDRNKLICCSPIKQWPSCIDHLGRFAGAVAIMKHTIQPSRRLTSRVNTPEGVWVYWRCNGRDDISQVENLSLGGLFVKTERPRTVGSVAQIGFLVEEGQIRAEAIVRRAELGRGLGMKFTAINEKDRFRAVSLIKRLRSLSIRGACSSLDNVVTVRHTDIFKRSYNGDS